MAPWRRIHQKPRPPQPRMSDETRESSRRSWCPSCGKTEPQSHVCIPICGTCGKAYRGGNGSGCKRPPGFCGSFPCCGCCEAPASHSSPEPVFETPDYPSLRFIFPDLKVVMNQLYEFLQSNRSIEFEFDRKPYQSIFALFKSENNSSSEKPQTQFIDFSYEAVLPTIRDLQGKEVTLSALQSIRRDQTKDPGIWSPSHGGYLDFITDLRFRDYWRPYVGQSTAPVFRVTTHHRRIQARSTSCLHYWVISQGDGQRLANFIRLWRIPFPEDVNRFVMVVLENFLEEVMCRAFHSLPPVTLQEVFGHSQEAYSGMGLNVVSPLHQGKSIAPTTRHIMCQRWDDSPDSDIRQWSQFRANTRQSKAVWSPSKRPILKPKDYCDIIRAAILKTPSLVEVLGNLEEVLPKDTAVIPWGPLSGNPIDVKFWFQETTSIFSDHSQDFIHPTGTLEASVGIVFGCTPCHQYRTPGGDLCNLPWGLKEVGFNESNSLIWPYNFQNFRLIPETFQSRPSSNLTISSLKEATQKLIHGSKLRIILVCGDEAEQVVIPGSSLSTEISLELHQGLRCRAWVEHDTTKIKRLFIRVPYLPCELWSSNAPAIYDLTNILRLVRALTGIHIRSLFYESGFVVTQVITGWGNEKQGKLTPLKSQDLEPLLRLWLAERGFDNDEDLEHLAEAADGSLRYAIQVLISCHPKRGHGKGREDARGIHRAQHEEYLTIPKKIRETVMEMFKQKSPVLFQTEKAGLGRSVHEPEARDVSKMNQVDCSSIPTTEKAGLDRSVHEPEAPDLSIMDQVKSFSIPTMETDIGHSCSKGRQARPSRSISLLFGSRHQGVERLWNHRTVVFKVHGIPMYLRTDIKPPGGFWIRADVSPIGERHPHLWAVDARSDDPGSRLAIRISFRDTDDREMDVQYPSKDGDSAACQANGLMDFLNGDHVSQIAKRPRRYVIVHEATKMILQDHPFLNGFIGGGYTDDGGNLVQHNRGKSRKRPREEEDKH